MDTAFASQLAMGHVICPERSPYAPSKVKPILSLTDSENENFESSFESSDPELIYEELLTSEQAQTLWEPESLMRLGLVCSSVSEDIEFDRLNNKLLISLKEFTTLNKVFCFKCKAMSLMTKRGKTNKTYQFACGSHTLSATQILGSLPDAFLLAHLPKEPRHIFNETLAQGFVHFSMTVLLRSNGVVTFYPMIYCPFFHPNLFNCTLPCQVNFLQLQQIILRSHFSITSKCHPMYQYPLPRSIENVPPPPRCRSNKHP